MGGDAEKHPRGRTLGDNELGLPSVWQFSRPHVCWQRKSRHQRHGFDVLVLVAGSSAFQSALRLSSCGYDRACVEHAHARTNTPVEHLHNCIYSSWIQFSLYLCLYECKQNCIHINIHKRVRVLYCRTFVFFLCLVCLIRRKRPFYFEKLYIPFSTLSIIFLSYR